MQAHKPQKIPRLCHHQKTVVTGWELSFILRIYRFHIFSVYYYTDETISYSEFLLPKYRIHTLPAHLSRTLLTSSLRSFFYVMLSIVVKLSYYFLYNKLSFGLSIKFNQFYGVSQNSCGLYLISLLSSPQFFRHIVYLLHNSLHYVLFYNSSYFHMRRDYIFIYKFIIDTIHFEIA